jgi:hypothetical protein
VFGTSGEGSTVIGMSGMLSSGRTLGFGDGVEVAAGRGGSWAVAPRTNSNIVRATARNLSEKQIEKVGVTRQGKNLRPVVAVTALR